MLLDKDLARLDHIQSAAIDAQRFIQGREHGHLLTDRLLLYGLMKCIEIIGEAAGRVSPECRARHPEIAWAEMIRMRNKVVHVYFDVNITVLWETVSNDLPILERQIATVIEIERARER